MSQDLPTLTTSRLRLTPVRAQDEADLHALWTQEPVRRFLWDGETIPLGQTREVIETSATLFRNQGFGLWILRRNGSSEMVGFAGYWYFRDPPDLELLFGVDPSHWGKGYAPEASSALLAYAFDTLGFDAVAASTDAPNTASIRVLEKLGMHPTRQEVVDGLDTLFFSLESPPR